MALVCHFLLGMPGFGVEVYEVVAGEVWAEDLVDDGVGVLGCDGDELLVVLVVAYIVEEVEICCLSE